MCSGWSKFLKIFLETTKPIESWQPCWISNQR
jgi:hypothetical protein